MNTPSVPVRDAGPTIPSGIPACLDRLITALASNGPPLRLMRGMSLGTISGGTNPSRGSGARGGAFSVSGARRAKATARASRRPWWCRQRAVCRWSWLPELHAPLPPVPPGAAPSILPSPRPAPLPNPMTRSASRTHGLRCTWSEDHAYPRQAALATSLRVRVYDMTIPISVPCSLFPVPCSLFPVPCSLFPVPCSLFPLPASRFPPTRPPAHPPYLPP